MLSTKHLTAVVMTTMFIGSLFFTTPDTQEKAGEAPGDERIYELRTYTTHPGKLDDLHRRFRDHTIGLFARHGMVSVGYWVPDDRENTLIYILSHTSREAAEQSWQAFLGDPEWQQAFDASRSDGPLVENIESVFMKAAAYSQIR